MGELEARAGDGVSLREITKETLDDVLRLKVAETQQGFVASNADSIAEAHFHPEAWFRAIYAGDVAVGFVMLEEWPEKGEYCVWRYMIDARHQGKGFGRDAMRLVIEHVRTRPKATELFLSYVPKEGNPSPFYARFGFEPTGEEAEGELVMRLRLK